MLEGPFVFVDVDTQRDFLDPDGALFIAGSTAIRPNLARLTAIARDRGIPIIATACVHLPSDPEFAVFPPHCLIGTPGQTRIPETEWPDGLILGQGGTLPDAIPPHLTLPKQQYDVFSNPDAERVIDSYSRGNPTFVVYGVATDYCVRCAVEGLLDRGKQVAIVADAIRAVASAAEPELLTGFVHRGALLTMTDAV
ncbi:cysteine hydrolase family protein [Tundrisphaera lichenicola]|uniref:cysteine hydrolase family protein n=1 Tax=Tundrisphaera lichenicola TaxID=2029860 RepID=UPI003EB70BEC